MANPRPSPTCKAWPLLGVLVPAPLHQVEHLVALPGPVVPDQLQPRPLPCRHLDDDGHHVGPWGKPAHPGGLPWEMGWNEHPTGAGLVFTCIRFLLHEHLPDDDPEAAGEERTLNALIASAFLRNGETRKEVLQEGRISSSRAEGFYPPGQKGQAL